MGGHVPDKDVLISETSVAHLAHKRRLFVALKP